MVEGRRFLWHVVSKSEQGWANPWGCWYLIIVSEDKAFNVGYALFQKGETHRLKVLNSEFPRLLEIANKPWREISCPNWAQSIITPSIVRSIIDWCFSDITND